MENNDRKHGNHELCVSCREKGSLTGIEKVISSCETSLNLVTSCGNLVIGGEKLKIIKFNAGDGTLEFEGNVSSLKYSGAKQPLIKRIFK
ncbi:MAG: hypothetical protein HFE47_05910 [Clostridia bacterium]|nr:hypothetical protein [Clostridia bacterium]